MEQAEKPKGTIEKALQINLDERIYGTVAEIGAGQEVARNFFMAGGAAGTIAKTMSAYDMQFSDAIYGTEEKKRYVSYSRVNKMLDREYNLVVERLQDKRQQNTLFFAFADTVAAKGYKSNRDSHGWMGVKFQLNPGQEPCKIVIHARMKDHTNRQQQVALGILGINLIHSAFYFTDNPKLLIESLLDGLTTERMEIDMIRFSGPTPNYIENRLMALHLVKAGLTHAVFFTPNGEPIQGNDLLYKKDILLLRGSYRPITKVHTDIIKCATNAYLQDLGSSCENLLFIPEISMSHLMKFGDLDPTDFLGRVDTLNKLGYHVQISDFSKFYELKYHMRQFTRGKIGITLGIKNMKEIFQTEGYENLAGGLMEGLGILFSGETKLYVYPKQIKTKEIITADEMAVPRELKYLYKHFLHVGDIIPLKDYKKEILSTRTKNIREDIKNKNARWKTLVPSKVCDVIEEQGLFGY